MERVSHPGGPSARYGFPAPGVGHGCLLEGLVLAMEGRIESFSHGRRGARPERLEEIWRLAQRHGVGLAPFFSPDGLWSTDDLSSARE